MGTVASLSAVEAPASPKQLSADPATLEVDQLELCLRTYAAHSAAAMCRFLLFVAEYDRREAYERWECRTCAAWLEIHCQVGGAAAREYVRVARALAALPAIAEAFGRGQLSYTKVRALTRVATAGSEVELLGLARDLSAAQLSTAMAVLERQIRPRTDDDIERAEARRRADRLDDGTGVITWVLRMSEDDDARFQVAIEAARDTDFEAARAEGGKVARNRGTGLPRLEAILAAMEAGIPRLADGSLPERYLTVLTIEDGYGTDPAGRVCLSNGMRLHPAVAARLGCDTQVQLVERSDDGGARMGRRIRTFTTKQRQLIARRFPTCGFPGCSVKTKYCQFHHIVHWTDGGPTDVENGIPQCPHHHRAIHEGGWRLWIDGQGRVVAQGPDGRRQSEAAPPLPDIGEFGFFIGPEEDISPAFYGPTERADRGQMQWVIGTLIDNHTVGALHLLGDPSPPSMN